MKRLALVIALALLFICAYAASANFDIIFNNITNRQVLITCDQSDGERTINAEFYDNKNVIVTCMLKSNVYLPLVEK